MALEKVRKVRDKWNKDRIKNLNCLNKRLRERSKAKSYINIVGKAIF